MANLSEPKHVMYYDDELGIATTDEGESFYYDEFIVDENDPTIIYVILPNKESDYPIE